MSLIEIDNISKSYTIKKKRVIALEGVSLSIEKGEIFGVIGLSGAGKSTLVRCLNRLEEPDSGEVRIDGEAIGKLSGGALRRRRQKTAMIFQHFNLLAQRNVLDNVCFPLEIAGVRKREARRKAAEILEAVGLSDKKKAYPSQLSGGQKQRVAIARALAAEPEIILCDEATSALDPETTGSILKLLREVNRKYGITIVMITHEMRVITEICRRVAVLHHGRVVETGSVGEVFAHPKTKASRRLVLAGESERLEAEIEAEIEEEIEEEVHHDHRANDTHAA